LSGIFFHQQTEQYSGIAMGSKNVVWTTEGKRVKLQTRLTPDPLYTPPREKLTGSAWIRGTPLAKVGGHVHPLSTPLEL